MSASVTGRAAGINAQVTPEGRLEVLSQEEVNRLRDASETALHETLWRCAFAVLNSGAELDDWREVQSCAEGFEIHVLQRERGIKLDLINAPAAAFVDGEMIQGIREHLFAVLRDIVYTETEIREHGGFDQRSPASITNTVFHILRNAQVLAANRRPDLVVCWGGHAITGEEYDYTKLVGYELGLRRLNICTGCGPGAMKGPMKGATIAHAKQRMNDRRYLGITEPGIIAAEAPNPIVNDLVIMPDIEKRLEAFVRVGHGFVIFPGGVGTTEEILYLLAILLDPNNRHMPLPVIFTGPASSENYFKRIDTFIRNTLGEEASQRYRIILDDPDEVARAVHTGIDNVEQWRLAHQDAFYFNWLLHIDPEMQKPFQPTHENMAALALHRDQPVDQLAASLRRAFSGIVSGNVRKEGVQAIEEKGLFEIQGDTALMAELDDLLASFVEQGRMKMAGRAYQPTYRIIR